MKKKLIALVMVLALVIGGAIGGTIAWLTTYTETITNTFTIGDINIELEETTPIAFDIVPGDKKEKDPKVTVKANSENAYVFVKVVVADNEVNSKTVVQWAAAAGWNYVVAGVDTDSTGVDFSKNGTYYFYRMYNQTNADMTENVLLNNEIQINSAIVKGDVTALTSAKPTLSFTAAAIQSDNIVDLADAWSKLPIEFTPPQSN